MSNRLINREREENKKMVGPVNLYRFAADRYPTGFLVQ
jgi:hypothetical protein